ncbi:MAG: AbrB/MazE/SpoVT family DNA-binding domain-containing protein [Methanobrevibacter boviskoreani]|uniref:AbrB/MazE/SpoVT family DNA-binding domain-containing protein n=1 Tax=Methanobrevibacter boviskoreani TaxID=1348249 RepID=UPI0023A8F333|nr:AbrB/MazE/SpoVT family DNA-binding domain-containing protein [Methanobrevibacter boviskoreani]MCI7039938.1 AbrB/MazE/SpoVT family DNA-binding domain-containing protein [Mollicutes bacterium]MDD7546430.1 AbrB/MazE/SpoVT family DNA-binding domain-containing protein [Bacilli bacterium]MDY4822833.1 AbrB/MazE/SpoVT family DNA-binding domain-containing protein [Candidatus Onthovivens sp.]MCI6930205.1 AbrB/MazE/SpoVT family DNA-binding domain-containing protein [Methanobrevibacter boviskoreani]MDY
MKEIISDKFIVTVKVGPKGQITIPKEGRKMFNIKAGDTLAILGDSSKGMAIIKADELYEKVGN